MWLRFDVAHTVFVTAGKQHVRWGTGHFWAPTDFLHLRPRNPLDVFDARTGTTMLKLHLPVESRAWNFYGYLLTESNTSTPTLGSVAAATRAELVLGPAELGLGAVGQRSQKPKFAADLSFGVGDVDVYGELGLRSGNKIDRVRYDANGVAPPTPTLTRPRPTKLPADAERRADAMRSTRCISLTAINRRSWAAPATPASTTTTIRSRLAASTSTTRLGYASPVAYPGLVLPHYGQPE